MSKVLKFKDPDELFNNLKTPQEKVQNHQKLKS